VGLGLARTGSVGHHGSGEIFLACGVGTRMDRDGRYESLVSVTGRSLDPLFEAVVEASEEAVLNSMLSAPTTIGQRGHSLPGLLAGDVTRLLRSFGRSGNARA
jgi:D-aminopeptidase